MRLIVSLTAACAVVLAILTLVGFAGRLWWRFELACHFRVQYFWLLAFASGVLWAGRRRPAAIVAGALALVNLLAIAPIYGPAPQAQGGGRRLRLVSFNVLSSNTRHTEVLRFLREQKADVLLLIEVTPEWQNVLDQLGDTYPHRLVESRDENFGVALFSRVPWQDARLLPLGSAGVPSAIANFQIDGRAILFVGTHPLPPASREMAALRNEQLAEVAKLIRDRQTPAIVAGDLNVTEYSPYFGDLLTVAALSDSRQGRGIQASWGPLPGLEIAIDHCLASPEIGVVNRQVGPHLGSDHRPLIVDLELPASRL